MVIKMHNFEIKIACRKPGFVTALTRHMMQCTQEMGAQHFFLGFSAEG